MEMNKTQNIPWNNGIDQETGKSRKRKKFGKTQKNRYNLSVEYDPEILSTSNIFGFYFHSPGSGLLAT